MSKTIADAIKQAFPNIDWDRFEDIDRALNWELWYGPLPANYWTEVEPLDHYVWKGYVTAEEDLREILDPIPGTMWFDSDGGNIVTDKNPEDYEPYWTFKCKHCDEWLNLDEPNGKWSTFEDSECEHEPDWNTGEWCGGEWREIDPREELMFVESWKQVF